MFYTVDVQIPDNAIITHCIRARSIDDARAKAWDHGEPVSDPEEIGVTAAIDIHALYAVESRYNEDIKFIPYKGV